MPYSSREAPTPAPALRWDIRLQQPASPTTQRATAVDPDASSDRLRVLTARTTVVRWPPRAAAPGCTAQGPGLAPADAPSRAAAARAPSSPRTRARSRSPGRVRLRLRAAAHGAQGAGLLRGRPADARRADHARRPRRVKRGSCTSPGRAKLPADDLATIERLWNAYSGSKFDYTLQRAIYNSKKVSKNLEVFYDRIGWKNEAGVLAAGSPRQGGQRVHLRRGEGAEGHLPLSARSAARRSARRRRRPPPRAAAAGAPP